MIKNYYFINKELKIKGFSDFMYEVLTIDSEDIQKQCYLEDNYVLIPKSGAEFINEYTMHSGYSREVLKSDLEIYYEGVLDISKIPYPFNKLFKEYNSDIKRFENAEETIDETDIIEFVKEVKNKDSKYRADIDNIPYDNIVMMKDGSEDIPIILDNADNYSDSKYIFDKYGMFYNLTLIDSKDSESTSIVERIEIVEDRKKRFLKVILDKYETSSYQLFDDLYFDITNTDIMNISDIEEIITLGELGSKISEFYISKYK